MAANPVLNDKRFEQVIADGYGTSPVTRTMTYGGTMSALGVMFAIICVSGWVGWSQVNQTTQEVFDHLQAKVGSCHCTVVCALRRSISRCYFRLLQPNV